MVLTSMMTSCTALAGMGLNGAFICTATNVLLVTVYMCWTMVGRCWPTLHLGGIRHIQYITVLARHTHGTTGPSLN